MSESARQFSQDFKEGDGAGIPREYLDARKVDLQLVPAVWWHNLVIATHWPEGRRHG